MKKKIKIGILTEGFIKWSGGIDFIRLIINGLSALNEGENIEIEIFVLISRNQLIPYKFKNILKVIANKIFKKKFVLQKNVIPRKQILNSFLSIDSHLKICTYTDIDNSLKKVVRRNNIEFIIPSFKPLSSSFPIPWIGFLFDFQHMYYPEYFSEKEILQRNSDFKIMVEKAKTIVVHSKFVKNDILQFYNNPDTKVFNLPFCPILNLNSSTLKISLDKYKLPQKYFMISNQFWKHKDHVTAFNGFKIFLDSQNIKNIGLVCTGQTYDNRFPNYFDDIKSLINELNLNNNVLILGFIPKVDQQEILKNCIALIQPTLFEGCPGGLALYEAISLGKRSIVSNIEVNRELSDETVIFFDSGSAIDLGQKMQLIFINQELIISKEDLIAKNKKSLVKFGNEILNILNESSLT